MNDKMRKLVIEIYGLLRLMFGLSEMIGLVGGYFLTEWVIQWPPGSGSFIFDEETLLLIYLVVFLHSVFHIVGAVGIARLKIWGRWLIFIGWPINMLITFGMVSTIGHEWLHKGYISQLSEVVSLPRVILYLAVVGFDYSFVSQTIRRANESDRFEDEWGKRFEGKHLAWVGLMTVLCMFLVLFLTKSVRQGMHQGFYKSRGEIVSQEAIKPRGELSQTPTASERESTSLSTLVVVQRMQVEASTSEPQGVPYAEEKLTSQMKEEPLTKQSPYQLIIGFLGGLCIVTALFYHMMQFFQKNRANASSTFFYSLLTLGFFFWIVYGMGVKLMPIYLTGVLGMILSAGILVLEQRE